MRWVREHRPFATVSRQMRMRRLPNDVDAGVAGALEVAETHYWTEEMCGLLAGAWPEIPQGEDEFRCEPHEVGPTHGYMWFAEPLPLVEGDPERLRAMLWASDPGGRFYAIVPFTVYMGPGAENVRGTFFPPPYQGAPRHVLVWDVGQSLSGWLREWQEHLDDPVFMANAVKMSGLDKELDAKQMIAWGKIWATAITIMGQTLVRLLPHRADRMGKKRLEKLQPLGPRPMPLVRAVLLRRQVTIRPGTPDGEHREVDWQWRWAVSKHWRQQWYPSLGRYKWIVIWPYVKGPANRPLKPDVPLKIVGR
jgi:hypothetical protein